MALWGGGRGDLESIERADNGATTQDQEINIIEREGGSGRTKESVKIVKERGIISKYKLSEIRNTEEEPSQIEPQQHLPLSLDGPILVATTPIYGGPAMQQLEAELDKGLKEGYIRNHLEKRCGVN